MIKLPRALFALFVIVVAHPVAAQEFVEGNDNLFGIFDEIRFGASYSIDTDLLLERFRSKEPEGVRVTGQLFMGPFGEPHSNPYLDGLLRPRLLLGGTLATDDGTNQVFAGIAGTYPIPFFPERYFFEGTIGGTIHDGPLESTGDGSDLGCRVLIRFSLGLGVDIGEHLRVMAMADHSSHADLCPGQPGNSGLTNAGVHFGYRF